MYTRIRIIQDRSTTTGNTPTVYSFCIFQSDRPGDLVVGGARETQELFDSPQYRGAEEG